MPVARRKAKHILQEFAFIRTLQRRFASRETALVCGIGEDAAVVASASKQWWHLTTDLLAEGVHFNLNTASPESVGYRAAMANLSDLAAMGAAPRYLLISLAIPQSLGSRHIYRLYAGLMRACRPHGVTLIGGDTSASKAGLFLSITLVGTTRAGRALFRKGARVGDRIYVTGTLGDSLAGLRLLAGMKAKGSGRRQTAALSKTHRQFLINRHLRPAARVEAGRWLNDARFATAAIDVSDGLSGDLRHLCEESGVGAEIDGPSIPLSNACHAYAGLKHLDPIQLALAGGEDYELLFTVSPKKQAFLERQAKARGFRVSCIGTIRPRREGVRIQSGDGSVRTLPITSYEHFRS